MRLQFQRTQLKGMLLPALVTIVSAATVLFYGFWWIPKQQRELNERNFRILVAQSALVKAKVDNFDILIDKAIEALGVHASADPERLGTFIKSFAPDVEIQDTDESAWGARRAREAADDPPVAIIGRDEGTNYLYLGYQLKDARGKPRLTVVARANLEAVASKFLTTGSDFDALLLVTRAGQVIVERAPSGLQLSRLDSTAFRIAPDQAAAHPGGFEALTGSRSLVDVTLGDTDYKLYVQPMQLSLQGEPVGEQSASGAPEPKSAASDTAATTTAASKTAAAKTSANKTSGARETKRQAEEWALCGLLRADRFQKASSNVSFTSFVRFSIGFAVILLALPLLKFHIISSRERLRASDMVQLAMVTFGLTALVVWALAHTWYFSRLYRPDAQQQLRETANALRNHLVAEMDLIRRQMDQFEQWPRGRWTVDGKPQGQRYISIPIRPDEESPQFIVTPKDASGPIRCAFNWPCEGSRLATLLRETPLEKLPYPYFQLMIWDDLDGWQRVKWSTAQGVTPFVNLDPLNFADYMRVRLARRNGATDVMPSPQGLVGVNQSPNTGDVLTSFWKALPISGKPPVPGRTELAGQMLSVATPISVSRPVLPDNVQFAVIRADGQVVFHSDPSRSVRENFFEECDNSPELRAAVKEGDGRDVDASYVGRPHLLHVTPLAMPKPWDGQAWSVVTFQSNQVQNTLDREVLWISGRLFIAYAFLLGLIWGALPLAWRQYPKHWFWPDPSQGAAYRTIALVNGAVFVMMAVWLGRSSASPTALLVVTLVLAFSAPLVAASIVRMKRSAEGTHGRWRTEYAVARASLLLLLAILPMAVFVRVAYSFEMKLFALRARADVERQIAERTVRVTNEMEKFALCIPGTPIQPREPGMTSDQATDCQTNAFLSTRLGLNWDVYTTVRLAPLCRTIDSGECAPATSPSGAPVGKAGDVGGVFLTTTLLDQLLASWHTPHNDFAQQLKAAYLAAVAKVEAAAKAQADVAAAGAAAETAAVPPKSTSKEARFVALPPRFKVDDSVPMVFTVNPGLGYWFLIGVVAFGVYLMIRYVSRRMFELDFEGGPSDAGMTDSGESVLFIGPLGAGKTARLRQSCALILDLRALTVEDTRATRTVGGRALQPRSAVQRLESMRGLTHWIDRFDASSLRGDTSFGINHLEHGLENQACRDQVLRLVEMLVYRHDRSVRIASTRDPLHVLSAIAGAAEPGTAEGLKRWRGVLQSFRRWNVGLVRNNNYLTDLQALVPGASPTVLGLVTAECSFSPQLQQAGKEVIRQLPEGKGSTSEVLALIGVAAESYYWSLWSARTWDEQVVLRQLADEGVVNRKNLAVLEQLKRHGLIVHRGRFEIMNETFKRFIKCAVSSDVVRAWERDGAQMTWSNFRTGLSAAAITLVILAFLTEYQLVTTWIGYAPALAPVVPIFMRFFAKGTDGDAGKSGANA